MAGNVLDPGLVAELACGAKTRADFETAIFELLDRQLGFDVGMFVHNDGVGPVTPGVDSRILAASRQHWDAMDDEMSSLALVAAAGRGALIDIEALGPRLQTFTYYRAFMQPHAGHCTLLGFLECRGVSSGLLVLGRTHRSRRFTLEAQSSLARILPTLSLACVATGSGVRGSQLVGERRPKSASTARATSWNLTRRELEIIQYLELGYSNEQIGTALGTKMRTVRNQLSGVYAKLQVATRAEAVAVWLRS
jgi:DNA-binding CsgD family transcriptional regulator